MILEDALILLYDLKRDKKGSYERPHKPVLLLAILDLIESGTFRNNRFHYTDELIERFKYYFEIVRKGNDKPTIENPFHFLSGDGFWTLVPKPDQPAFYEVGNSGSPSVRAFREDLEHAEFIPELWNLLDDSEKRIKIRQALVCRYFPEHATSLGYSDATSGSGDEEEDENPTEEPPARMGAFRKIVTRIYDYRCCACGLRVMVDNMVMVDAAHLIPFSESQNDNPANGLALCKNHHWAMDRNWIAPCPDMRWKVSSRLDSRIPDLKDFVNLNGQRVIPPDESMFHPAEASLAWREANLL